MKIVTSFSITDKDPIKTDGYICLELNTILRAVCYINGVSIYDVKGKRRYRELVTARQEYCYLACKLTQLSERNPGGNSLTKIGNEIDKNHATVLHHNKIIENWLDMACYKLAEKMELIKQQL